MRNCEAPPEIAPIRPDAQNALSTLEQLDEPEVNTTEGIVKGIEIKTPKEHNKHYYSFLGIPYARPPIAEYRFCPPEPPEPWDYVRSALHEPDICIQYDPKTDRTDGAEDCLYLNVFTPKLPGCCSKLCPSACKEPIPVMVYIHGGGFTFGNGVEVDKLGPDYFVKNNVVLVTINYRLNVFGFLSLDRSEAPGNMGLKDQVMALQWVQKNIINFNGDPNNVTIFGCSAGAASVNYHLISPMSKGLFHKAIAQSGSAIQHWAFNRDIKSLAYKMAEINNKEIEDDDQLLNYLINAPANQLVKLASMVVQSTEHKGGIYYGFVPTLEVADDWEPFLTEIPYNLIDRGEFYQVPYLSGFCTRESLTLTIPGKKIISDIIEERNLLKYIPFKVLRKELNAIEKKLGSVYLNEKLQEEAIARSREDSFAVTYMSDVDHIGGVLVSTSLIAKNNTAPVYLYEFSYDGLLNLTKNKLNIKIPGACHGDEIGYLFKQKLKVSMEMIFCTDKLLRERMSQMWTNFATHGDPTPKLDNIIKTEWEPVTDPDNLQYLKIDEHFQMCENPCPGRFELFRHLYNRYRETNVSINTSSA